MAKKENKSTTKLSVRILCGILAALMVGACGYLLLQLMVL